MWLISRAMAHRNRIRQGKLIVVFCVFMAFVENYIYIEYHQTHPLKKTQLSATSLQCHLIQLRILVGLALPPTQPQSE